MADIVYCPSEGCTTKMRVESPDFVATSVTVPYCSGCQATSPVVAVVVKKTTYMQMVSDAYTPPAVVRHRDGFVPMMAGTSWS